LEAAIKESETDIRKNNGLSEIFINKITNRTLKQNETVKMIKLAKTLEIISKVGASAFYNGSLTDLMVDEINNNGEQNLILSQRLHCKMIYIITCITDKKR